MPDLDALYSNNGQTPDFLPNEIFLSTGLSRTDSTTFTDEELSDAGFTGPYVKPEYDPKTQVMHWSSEQLSYIVEDILQTNPLESDAISEQDAWILIRAERNHRLSFSDWMVLPDIPYSEEKKAAILKYRQDLRDLPLKIQNPKDEVVWPKLPE